MLNLRRTTWAIPLLYSLRQGCILSPMLYNIYMDLHGPPSTSTITNQPKVPSPFKKALNWNPLNYAQTKPGRNRGIGPGAVTSKQWQEEHLKKMEKKQEAEETKKRRAEERIRKKEEREELKKRKNEEKEKKKQAKLQPNTKTKRRKVSIPTESSSEEEWQPSQESEDENEDNDNTNELMETGVNVRTSKKPDGPEQEENNCDTINNDQIIIEILSTDRDLLAPCTISELSPVDVAQYALLCNINQDEKVIGTSDLHENINELLETDMDEKTNEEEDGPEPDKNYVSDPKHYQFNMEILLDQDQLPPCVSNQSPLHMAQSSLLCDINQDAKLNGKPDLHKEESGEYPSRFVVGYASKKRSTKVLYKIVDKLVEDEYIVHEMKPCNRFRTVFAEDIHNVKIINDCDIVVKKVPQPLVYGKEESRRYQFSEPIDVR